MSMSLTRDNKRLTRSQDPTVQKFTGKTDRVDVMKALREAKNSM